MGLSTDWKALVESCSPWYNVIISSSINPPLLNHNNIHLGLNDVSAVQSTTPITALPLHGTDVNFDVGLNENMDQLNLGDNMESLFHSGSSWDDLFTPSSVQSLEDTDVVENRHLEQNLDDSMKSFFPFGNSWDDLFTPSSVQSLEDTDVVENRHLEQNVDDSMESFFPSGSSWDDVFTPSMVQSLNDTDVDETRHLEQNLDDSMESLQDLRVLAKPSYSSSYCDSIPPSSVTSEMTPQFQQGHKQDSEMTRKKKANAACKRSRDKKRQLFENMKQRVAELQRENEELKRVLHVKLAAP